MNLCFFIIIATLLVPCSSYGQVDVISLKNGNFLGQKLQILKSHKKLTIKEAVQSNGFLQATQEVPRFGYIKDDIWAKLEIENKSPLNEEYFLNFVDQLKLLQHILLRTTQS